ncbi:hypothetical protein C1Y35_17690 [Pseudomonas sp. GW456-L14]|uniref:SMI1/KNR4 family protein n=1 Tax=unclassified Pseudomonas TaxID=196821 RepID=UPI000C88BCEE|nr:MULTISPECIES: SMI1/KNR4 family protein [unclassified Pseudomonas]PMY38299.1 hypothetical protein C1Y35_17690 [Pseudomonas sp. GW456-L14]PMY52777.1 hypothetical protein C1Y34_21385 [Pseudomonas sp. GW456-L12]
MKTFLEIESIQNCPFPKSFVDFINKDPKADLEPWWLLAYKEGKINSWHKTLKQLYPKRALIPFAKFSANDDIACFDGEDLSENPKVLIIHAYASEGWEHHSTFTDFNSWLSEALKTRDKWNENE